MVAHELAGVTQQHLVTVQSVLVEDYWRELRSGLERLGHEVLHVLLEAREAVLRQRIEADQEEAQAVQWRIDHLPVYAAARGWMTASADLVVDPTSLSPGVAADHIIRTVHDHTLCSRVGDASE